jgi:uncharacterized protein YndB with AHSA1/START domain
MSTPPFEIERMYNAPIQTVWRALTDKEEMKKWYFDLPEFKPEVGFEFRFTGGTENNSYLHICTVTEVVEGRKLTHSWRYDGYEGNSFVTFELFDEGEKTRLKLTHAGLETFPQDKADFARENFVQGWTAILGTALADYLKNPNT